MPTIAVQAQYNPKELEIKKVLEWTAASSLNGTEESGPAGGGTDRNRSDLEIHSPPTRSMTLELLFDGYESGKSIQPKVDKLEQLTSLQVLEKAKTGFKAKPRAHHCLVAWGAGGGVPPLPCVIMSLSTKYQMWDSFGTPLRATCTVELKGVRKMAGALIVLGF
jgi:hypothetical protein